jgi:2'-5' RNA ligase
VAELEGLRPPDTPTQSALFIPVEEADSIIGRWRHEHDPLASAGVPAHITLIVPWLQPELITADRLSDLDETLRDVKAFEFELTHVDWFGGRVLWAAPVPTRPFLDLIQRLAERYGTPTWGGQFDEVIPHLTIAHAGAEAGLVSVAADVAVRLPLRCHADQVWVMVGGGGNWEVVHRVHLVG